MKIKRAVLSVADKTGIVEFGRGLVALGAEVISTGGTASALRAAGVPVTPLSDVTGFPEILDGRVKTLHPAVHGGLLAVRGNPAHDRDLARHDIGPIDLVAVTLYPFEAALARGAGRPELIEEIDIGGVTLLRAAAKNAEGVAVLSDPSQYGPVLDELRETGTLGDSTRRRLAASAFARTSAYDAAIARYLGGEAFPDRLVLSFEKVQDCRYGENPHQRGAFYREPGVRGPSVSTARQLGGKELSYNNVYDLDAALELVREFPGPAAVIVKHGIPCGVGTADELRAAYVNAREGDPMSAFGGIVALNREVDAATADALGETFLEAVIAPGYADGARAILARKKNLRVMEVGPLERAEEPWGLDLRRVRGGLLVQDRDVLDLDEARLRVVTSRAPTESEWADLRVAWTVCRYVRSNAVVMVRDRQVVGVGAGQMNRVEPVYLAAKRAGERAKGAAMASEAFFPFPDAVEAAIAAGVTAIMHPGGSKGDAAAAASAEAAGVAMVTTGIRHFRH